MGNQDRNEKLTEAWRTGWHRVTFYGDPKPQGVELGDRLKRELIEETQTK